MWIYIKIAKCQCNQCYLEVRALVARPPLAGSNRLLTNTSKSCIYMYIYIYIYIYIM